MENILSKLDVYTRAWALNLTEEDVAKLLQAVYKLPGLLETLKCKSDKAVTIGKEGETKFLEICRKLPGNYTIQDTSKQGKKGDFVVTYSECGVIRRCLIDIKNYSSTVPKKEIDKFNEDLAFGSYDAGLLISYTTKFAGIADHLCLQDECTSSGKIPVMYLVSQDEEMILPAIELLIAKTYVPNQKNADIDRIESLVETVNNSLSNSSDIRRMLSELQCNVSKSVQKCQENLITHEAQVKRAVRALSSCVSKIMVDRITPFIPKIETRIDNVDPISTTLQKNLDSPAKAEATETINKSDRYIFDELISLTWDDIDYPLDGRIVCELTSKNMVVKILAYKTKTSVQIDFLEELEILETDIENIECKITEDNSFICTLNLNLVAFVKKYMNI